MANGAVKDFILKQTQSGASTSTVKQRIAAQEANSLMGKINALQGNVQNIGNQYNQRYFDANGQSLPPAWRADSSDWLKAVEPMNAAANEASALRWRLQRYESYLDADTYKKAADTLDAINSSARSIYSHAKQESDVFSKFQNADDYNRTVELSNLYTGWDTKTEKQIEEEWNNLNHNLTLAYGADDAASIDATNKRLGELTGYILGTERLADTPVSAMAADYRYNRNIEQRDSLSLDTQAAAEWGANHAMSYGDEIVSEFERYQMSPEEKAYSQELDRLNREILMHERSPQYIEMSNINLRKQKGYDEKAASRPYTNPTKAEMDAYDSADHTTQPAPIVNDPLRVYLDSSKKDKEDAVSAVANAHENGKSSTYYEYVAMGGDKRWDLLTKDEINDYYYYLSESPEAGRQYLDRMETVLNARAMREYNKEISELPLAQRQAMSVLSSIYYSVLSPIEGVKATLLYGLGGITGKNLYDKNDNKLISRTDAFRANTAEEMNKSGKTFLGVPIGNLFQSVVSGADSLMLALYTLGAGIFIPETASATALKVFEEAPGAALGMSAARSKMDQVYEQGGRIDQVLASGFNAYATEWLTERFSIGMFLDDVTKATVKSKLQVLKSISAQAGVNAAEEGAARLMETALDWLTLHRTEYTDVIRQKMAEGKSREEATKDATHQFLIDLLGDVLGGAIAGSMFAGASVVSSAAYNSMNKAYATDIIENNMVDRTIASAQTTLAQLKEGSGQYKRLNAAIEAVQKEASVKNVQKLLRQFDLAVTSVSANAISEMAPIIGEDEAKQLKSNIKTSGENLAVAQMAADEELAKKAVEHKLKTGTGTVDLKTGNDIKIEGVYRTREKGNPTLVFKLADGSTIKYDDVSYSSNATAAMAQVISETGIRADYAMSLLNSASDEGGLDAAGVHDAILSGMIGEAVKTARHAGMSYALTDQQFKTAYEAGKMLANDKLNREIGLASQKTVPTAQAENKGGKVVGQFYDGTEGAVLRSTTKAQIRGVEAIAKATNVNVEIYASSVVDGVRQFTDRRGAVHKGNAAYIPGINTIVIDINAGNALNGLVLNSLAHEVVHFIKEMAPDKFRKLADFVVGKFGEKGKSVTSLILAKQKTYRMQGYELSFMDAYEEVVADSVESMFSQKADKIVADIAEMRKVDADLAKTFVDKIKDTFKKMLSVFKENDFQPTPDSEEGKFFAEWTEVQDELAHLFAEGAAAAADRVAMAAKKTSALTEDEKKAETTTAADLTKEGLASVVDSSGQPLNQLRTMKQDLNYYMQDLKDAGLVGKGKALSEEDLDYLYNSINRVMGYVEDHLTEIERSEEFRNMDGSNRPFLPYKDNSDPHYRMALDYSTLCRKRLLTQAITERLQSALKRALSPVEQVRIRNEIKKLQDEGKKLDVACALCYVEAARLKSPKVINDFLNNKAESLKNYFSLKNKKFKDEVYQVRLGDWKAAHGLDRNATKADIKAAGLSVPEFNKFALEVRKGYWKWAEQYDSKTFQEQDELIKAAEAMDNQEFLSATSLARLRSTMPDLYDAFIFKVRSATRSKAQETDVPYKRGDIDMVGDAIIEQMNEESGFRHQSWSDFQAMHLLDTIAAIIELSTKKAKVHTYTKVSDMVRFLGETNMAINMSLIPDGNTGLDENGELIFDPVEGMAFEIMKDLRDKFHATAGNIAIGISDEQIKKLLASPLIDYVIPYHTSGLNADMRKRMGIKTWKDYSKAQNEKGDGKKPTLAEWFDAKEAVSAADGVAYMVNASEKYLALCHERGLTPKFPAFLKQNSDGSYSLADDAQNYWKLLIDRKMVDQVTGGVIIQKAVVPKFNVDTMLDILSNEVDSQAAKDARAAEDYIVNKMLTDNSPFTKAERDQARIIRDAALRMAIENTTAGEKTLNSLRNDTERQTIEEINEILTVLMNGKRKVYGYTVYINRDYAPRDGATITIKKPDGNNEWLRIDGGKYWTNEDLRLEAATLIYQLKNGIAPTEDNSDTPNSYESNSPTFVKNTNLRSVSEHQALADMFDALPAETWFDKRLAKYRAEHKTILKELNNKHERLDELNDEWRALKFDKDNQSHAVKTRLSEIRRQMDAINQDISALERKLLDLAELRPFRNLVDAAVKRQKAAGKNALSEYRENAKLRAKKEKLMRLFKDINTFVIRNAKDHHVPADLRKQLVEALNAFDYGYSNNQKAKAYLLDLKEAYEEIANSNNPLVSAWYDSSIEDAFENAKAIVGETNLYNMNEEQTDALYKLLKMIRTRIAKSNQLFNDNLRMTAQQAAYSSTDELKAAKKKERHEPGGKIGEYIEQRTFDDLKPIYFFSRLGSPTMQKLFQNILEGQYVYANDIREAEEFITALNEKYNAKKWKADDKFTFTDAAGESFQLTRREVWDIYAHSRREQSRKHLLEHGIVLSEAREVDEESAKGVLKKKKYRINDTRNHPLSEVVIGDILSDKVISKEEKAYVEELQKYLSVDLAQKGNEVSLAMYDVALYGEKNYWPIKTAKWYNEFDPQGKGNPSIATPNHSKGVAKYASSPIVINDALTTWNQHLHDMAAYHGLAIPVSDFTRVVNAKTLDNPTSVGGVRQTLEELYGSAPGRYIAQLLNDMNGNVVSGIDDTFVEKGITLGKKASVMMSLSVAIQQPSSIIRASLYIKPKYLASRKKYEGMTVGNVMERWKQLCKIAPIAYIKEMGGYDTGLGRTATEHLRKLEGKQVKDIIDDIMGFLPSFMDKITWLRLYDGAVAQVTDEAAQRNENIGKAEIEKRAVALFNEAIEWTQVYDSTLTRSGTMRKPGAGTKALTAFGAEPTIPANMMSDAIVRVRRSEAGAKKMLAKTFGAVISSALVNALLKAIVTAPRDDDENEMLYEKYIGNVLNSFIVDAFIFTNVPVVRDIVSMLQGFSVDRMDLSVFQDIFDRWEKVFKGDLKWVEVVDALVELTSLSPVPLRNVWRDLKGAYNFVVTLGKDISGENKPTWTGLGIAATDSIPILSDTSKQNALYAAYASGRQGDIQYFRSQYASATAADTAIKTALKKNDPDVREAATLRYNGNVERSAALVNKIAKRTNVPLNLVQEAVMSEVEKMQSDNKPPEKYSGEEETETSTPSAYTTTDLKLALESGRDTAPIVEAIIADKKANGATRNQARNQVRQSAWGAYKSAYYDAYKDGNKSEMDRIKKILLGTKLWTESELKNTLSNFIKNKEEE